MKLLPIIFLASCSFVQVKTPSWSLTRASLLQQQKVPSLTISKDGSAALMGYEHKPDAESIQAITEGVVKAVLKP